MERPVMRRATRISLVLLIAAAGCGLQFLGRGKPAEAAKPSAKVTVEVPPEVKDAVAREVGGGRVVGLSTDEDKDKNLLYVVHAQIDGSAYTIRLDPDGTLIDKECDEPDPDPAKVSADDLPAAVRATLKAETGGAPAADVTRQDKQAVYELHVRIDGHAFTLRIDDAGKLLSKERDDDDTTGKTAA